MSKKSARSTESMSAVNFRLRADLKRDLELLAMSAGKAVTTLLVDAVTDLVAANKDRIAEFQRQAAIPINKPTFDLPPTNKKLPAQGRSADNAADPNHCYGSNVDDDNNKPKQRGDDDYAEN